MSFELTINRDGDWLHATVTGRNTADNVDAYMQALFKACREANCARLLIEERLDGPRLSTLEVFKIASRRAEELRGHFISIAYVDVYAEGDLMTFAETVAKNRGSQVKVFASVADAEDWLRKSEAG